MSKTAGCPAARADRVLLVSGLFRAESQNRPDTVLSHEIDQFIRKPEMEHLCGRYLAGVRCKTDGPDGQIRVKTSCETGEYKKIRRESGQFRSKRLSGRLGAHSAFDQDDLFSREFAGELL